METGEDLCCSFSNTFKRILIFREITAQILKSKIEEILLNMRNYPQQFFQTKI